MLVIPSPIWTPSAPRFGSWWRRPFRNPLASFLKYASGGHLAYAPTGGHLVYSCAVCGCCATDSPATVPSSVDFTLSGFPDYDCATPFRCSSNQCVNGGININGISATASFYDSCAYEANVPITPVTISSTYTASYLVVDFILTCNPVVPSKSWRVDMALSELAFNNGTPANSHYMSFYGRAVTTVGAKCMDAFEISGDDTASRCTLGLSTGTLDGTPNA